MKHHTVLSAIVIAAGLSLVAATAALAGVPPTQPPVRVPEPGTIALIGTGVAVVAAHAWWRNRK